MNDEQKIKATALNYIEGWYEGNKTRMTYALHDSLVKRRFVSKDEIWQVNKTDMEKLTAEGRGKLEDPKTGRKEVTILDINDTVASVKIISEKFVDYLHLIKENNEWVIVDVLWDYILKK